MASDPLLSPGRQRLYCNEASSWFVYCGKSSVQERVYLMLISGFCDNSSRH